MEPDDSDFSEATQSDVEDTIAAEENLTGDAAARAAATAAEVAALQAEAEL